MIQSFPITKHRETSLVHLFENHVESLRITRSVNGSRPQDNCLQPSFLEFVYNRLGLVFCALIIIFGGDRRILPCWGVVYVSVNTACAAIDKFPHPFIEGRLKNIPGS